jgi:dephospho-CoA kinase
MWQMSDFSQKPVIGIVGAIGAGKSLAATILANLGGAIIDADRIGHEALKRPEVLAKLTQRWGPRVVRPDGTPDRRAIAGIVFHDPAERMALEAVVFPYIQAQVREQVTAAQNEPAVQFVVLDAAVMLEAGWHGVCDKMVYVDAPRELRLARVAARSGWTAEDLAAREAAQKPAAEKMARADAIVMNDSTPDELRAKLEQLLAEWEIPASARAR